MNSKNRDRTHKAIQKALRLLYFCVFAFAFSACGYIRISTLYTATSTDEPPTVTPTPRPTETEVIEWFPATNTPRPLSTPSPFPTVRQIPDTGDILVQEDFDNDDNWMTFRSAAGNAVISNHELTLGLQESANEIVSFSSLPQYGDYYLSLDVDLSLCSYYRDIYGISFRVKDSDNLYRWLFNCRGETRVERFYKGKLLVLSNWAENGGIRPGAPQRFSLGIAADGSDLKFFINEALIASAEDTVLTTGGYGLLASSDGYAPLTVSFSNFRLYQLK